MITDNLMHEVDGRAYAYSRFSDQDGITVVISGGHDQLSGKPKTPYGGGQHMIKRNGSCVTLLNRGADFWRVNRRLSAAEIIELVARR